MLTETLRALFARDLRRLAQEIELYKEEQKIWEVAEGISNPAGNLCLHLVGNLKTYVGAELGGLPYTRNRDLEFSARHIPRAELLGLVAQTREAVEKTLSQLTESDLQQEYPQLVLEARTSTAYFLVHLLAHLGYHLGQINYHRRLLDT
jgi:uncharacterized damage-inducible protein DinB